MKEMFQKLRKRFVPILLFTLGLLGCSAPPIPPSQTEQPSQTTTQAPTQTAILLTTVPVTENRGGNPWSLHAIRGGHGGPDGIRLADFNGDGLLDVTTSFESSGDVYLFLHPGLDNLDAEWPSVMVGNVPRGEDAFGMDVDNNGVMDIVSAHEGDTLGIYVHWGPSDPTLTLTPEAWQTVLIPATQGKAWLYAIPLDVNTDGNLDIVMGAKDDYFNNRNAVGDIGWLEAPTGDKHNLENWEYHTMDHAGWPMSIIAHDVDGDEYPDILLTDRNSDEEHMGARWLENPGENWEEEWNSHFFKDLEGSRPGFMGMGDLDKDGSIDYIFPLSTENQIALLNGAEDQLVILSWPSQINGALKGTAVGDLNLDGDPDLVVTSEQSNLGIGWMNYTNSPFASSWTWNPIYDIYKGKFDQSVLYDVDLDGDLDVLTTEEVQGLGVVWFENPAID